MPPEPSKIFRAVNSSKFAIIAGDYEDRRMGTTSQKLDYPAPPPAPPSNIADIKVLTTNNLYLESK